MDFDQQGMRQPPPEFIEAAKATCGQGCDACEIWEAIWNHDIGQMPPPTDHIAILLDTIQAQNGFDFRADVWRRIGVDPVEGRKMLGKNSRTIIWPIWFVLLLCVTFGSVPGGKES